jgi:hypothetical protein
VSEPFIGAPLTTRRTLMNLGKKAVTSAGDGFLNTYEERLELSKEIDNNLLR